MKIVVEGVGEAKGELVRILAPLTVGAILGKLPLKGRGHVQGGGLSMILGIRRGAEKAVNSVKAGGHRVLADAGLPRRLFSGLEALWTCQQGGDGLREP